MNKYIITWIILGIIIAIENIFNYIPSVPVISDILYYISWSFITDYIFISLLEYNFLYNLIWWILIGIIFIWGYWFIYSKLIKKIWKNMQ